MTIEIQVRQFEVDYGVTATVLKGLKITPGYKHGSGAYGTVYQSLDHPDRVIKVAHFDVGYFRFIKTILNMKKHNPYFPRVHKAFLCKYPTEYPVLVVEIERLNELDH